jgi:hypothetical protein
LCHHDAVGTWADNRRTILDAVGELPKLPWSLRIIVDDKGADTGFAALRGRIEAGDREAFDHVAGTHRLVGMMQWWGFPVPHYSYAGERYVATPREPAPSLWDRPEIEACEAWCYCAREPDDFLPPDRPRFLLSNSDFVDAAGIWSVAHGSSPDPTTAKRWDVVCSFSGHWFDEIQKSWSLARACIDTLAVERALSVLLLSRTGIPDLPRHPNVDVRPRLSWEECMGCIARSRLALVPYHLDPSPRLITESLALDVPVLVNSQILGGWKYVQPETGGFFEDDFDVAAEAERSLSASHQPKSWVRRHYGRDRAARRFASYLRSLGGADHVDYALPTALFL